MPNLLTVKQVATELNVSTSVVYALAQARKISTVRIGVRSGGIRVKAEDLQAFIESRTVPAMERPAGRLQLARYPHLEAAGFDVMKTAARAAAMTTPELMTVKQVAVVLNVSDSTVYALLKAKRLAHCRVGLSGGAIRVARADLDRYLEECLVPGQLPESLKTNRPGNSRGYTGFKHLGNGNYRPRT